MPTLSGARLAAAAAILVGALLSLAPAPALAQAPGTVTGSVVAAESGSPLATVSVAIRRAADSVVVGGRMTAADGRFTVSNLPPGRYILQATRLGFAPLRQGDVVISAEAPVADVGRLSMSAVAVEMEGVAVQGQRSPVTVAADRTIYQTREMPVAEGGVATDVLRTVPELEVDIEGKVSLRGTGVQVQLNGRRAPMQGEALDNFLQQLPANRIERIEVIPNPSARYEAEGQGGIINIVLRENVDLGLSGNLSFNASTRGQNGMGGRLSYQKGRVTLFGGGSLSLSGQRFDNSDLRRNLIANPVTSLTQVTSGRNEGTFGSGDLTAEYKISDKATAWAEARAYQQDFDSDGTTAYTLRDLSETLLERYDRGNVNDGGYLNGSYALGFRHAFRPQQHEFFLELRRSDGGNDTETRSSKISYPVEEGDAALDPELTVMDRSEDNAETTLAANYIHPLGSATSIEAGYRGMLRETGNDQEMIVTSPSSSAGPISTTLNGFDFTEEFHALYFTANRRWGKLSLQAGVRAELAETVLGISQTDDEYANDYASIFPSANVAYDLAPGKQLRLMYSKRVQRPYVFYLNPVNPSPDPLNRQVGNPDLLPMYTHSFGADASWNGNLGTLRIAPYYRRTVDSWDQFKSVDEQGVSTVTWKNLASMESYGSNFIVQVREIGPAGGFLSFNAWREERNLGSVDAEAFEPKLRWSTNLNGTLRLPGGWMMQGSANYSPARDIPQGRISTTVMSTFGVRKQLWGTKASVNLMAMDPLDVYRYRFETRDRTHVQTARTQPSMRRATLSFTYNFGRPPQSQRRSPTEEAQGAPDAASQIR